MWLNWWSLYVNESMLRIVRIANSSFLGFVYLGYEVICISVLEPFPFLPKINRAAWENTGGQLGKRLMRASDQMCKFFVGQMIRSAAARWGHVKYANSASKAVFKNSVDWVAVWYANKKANWSTHKLTNSGGLWKVLQRIWIRIIVLAGVG